MTLALVLGLCGFAFIMWWVIGVAVAFGLTVMSRRHSNDHMAPPEIAASVAFWPIALVFLLAHMVYAGDRKVERREVRKFEAQEFERLALEKAHEELGLPKPGSD